MRIIVTGSRNWPESCRPVIWEALHGLWWVNQLTRAPLIVVHGNNGNVDKGAQEWVQVTAGTFNQASHSAGYWVHEEPHDAEWESQGNAAGPIRNQEMAALGADLCVAFIYEPTSEPSKGTRNMMKCAKVFNIAVIEVPCPI